MKFVIAEIEGAEKESGLSVGAESKERDLRIDRFVGFKIKGYFLFFPFVGQDGTNEKNETVRRNTVVQFQTLLRASNSCEHGQSIDA